MERRSIARALLALAATVGLAMTGCQSTSGSQTASQTGSEFDDASGGMGSGSDAQAIGVLQAVYFDYDRSDIRGDAGPTLRTNGDAIKQNADWGTLTIEGHCDERGSEEYNLALGDRRANQVRRYLVDLGVPSSRLRTVSFGEAKPAVMGHDESAWRYNRRAEFVGR